MSDPTSFNDLVRRVRAGDERAASELVRLYEPVVRRAVRFRLADERLRRVFDSQDICQSVMASFFVRAALGQYELEEPGQLVRLLTTMARNKLATHTHHANAARRDQRRNDAGGDDGHDPADPDASPSRVVAFRDLLDEARRRLSQDERQLFDWRGEGLGWAEIASKLGTNAETLRKRLDRAVERVAAELGLED